MNASRLVPGAAPGRAWIAACSRVPRRPPHGLAHGLAHGLDRPPHRLVAVRGVAEEAERRLAELLRDGEPLGGREPGVVEGLLEIDLGGGAGVAAGGLLTHVWVHALPGSAGLRPERVSFAMAMRALG